MGIFINLLACYRAITRKEYLKFSLILFLLFWSLPLVTWYVERDVNKQFSKIEDSYWWAIVTITTTGYGDMAPITRGGRLCAVLLMLTGISLLATVLGAISAKAIESSRKAKRGLKPIKVKGNVVVCGWNSADGPNLIQELLLNSNVGGVTIIANLSEIPVENHRVDFVSGLPSKDEILRKANVSSAKAVLILAQDWNNPDSDVFSFLIFQKVRRLAPSVHISVEIVDPENAVDFPGCACIDVSRMGTNILVKSVVDTGIEGIVSQLISDPDDSGFFTWQTYPREFVGKTFGELLAVSAGKDFIPVGIQKSENILLNPPRDTSLDTGDILYIIAPQRPK